MRKLITILFTFCFIQVFGQNMKVIEQDLLKKFNKIAYWSGETNENIYNEDSLANANNVFQKGLLHYSSKYASTINYDFKELVKKGLTICTSSDGKFRIYSWDNMAGGTMRFQRNISQYKNGDRVFSKISTSGNDEADPGCWYSEIYILQNSGSVYYLAVFNKTYSNRDSYEGLKCFRIINNTLDENVKLIKTSSGIKNTIGFSFDFLTVIDRKERPVKLMNYNTETKTISFPIVLEDGTVTGKSIVYQFTGKYFEKKNK